MLGHAGFAQGQSKSTGSGVALGGISCQCREDYTLDSWVHVGCKYRRRNEGRIQSMDGNIVCRRTDKWRPTREELVKHRPQRVDIHPSVDGVTAELLWGHVIRCSYHHVILGGILAG